VGVAPEGLAGERGGTAVPLGPVNQEGLRAWVGAGAEGVDTGAGAMVTGEGTGFRGMAAARIEGRRSVAGAEGGAPSSSARGGEGTVSRGRAPGMVLMMFSIRETRRVSMPGAVGQ